MATETERGVSATAREALLRDGYYVARGLFDAAEVAPVRARLEEFYEGRHEYEWPNPMLRSFDPEDRNTPGGNFRSGSLQKPAEHEEVFHRFCYAPQLLAAFETLLGDAVTWYTDQTIFKPGVLRAGRSFYHQDTYYWKLRPGVCLNCWIALDEVDADAIALGFQRGSHAAGRIQHHEEYWDEVRPKGGAAGQAYKRKRIPLDLVDDAQDILTPGQPGDAFFFTNYTWHRAEPNLSGSNKAAYAIAFQLDRPDNKLSDSEFQQLLDGAPEAT